MLEALQALRSKYPFTVKVIDVDSDAALVEQYDELVPVLLGSKNSETPVRLCHYFLNEQKVMTFLRGDADR